MSEIEKMYENAGIDYEERYNNCTLNKEGQCELKCSCDICKYSEEKYIYPPFTAEKQFEILKIIVHSHGFNSLDKPIWDKGWDIAIARLVNFYWQDLIEKEKQQVKGILE